MLRHQLGWGLFYFAMSCCALSATDSMPGAYLLVYSQDTTKTYIDNKNKRVDFVDISNKANPATRPLLEDITYFNGTIDSVYYLYQDGASAPLCKIQLANIDGELKIISRQEMTSIAGEGVSSAVLSRDGNFLAGVVEEFSQSSLYVRNLQTNETRKFTMQGKIVRPAWSPSGDYIAFYHRPEAKASVEFAPEILNLSTWELKTFPVSLPTRPAPLRDENPTWNKTSEFVLFEGLYETKPIGSTLMLNVKSGRIAQAYGGFFYGDNEYLIADFNDPRSINTAIIYKQPVEAVFSNSFVKDAPFSKSDDMDFMRVLYSDSLNLLLYQNSKRIICAYDLKTQQEFQLARMRIVVNALFPLRY